MSESVPLLPGPTAASAAIAAGRPSVSSSFRFHRPRGPMCGLGYCEQCVVSTPSGPALACEIGWEPATRRRDWLRPLGRLAEKFPPWFYERRFLRPRALQGISLHVLRHLSAAQSLPGNPPLLHSRRFEEVKHETVLVGDATDKTAAWRVPPTSVVGIYPDRTLGVLTEDSLLSVHFERLMLATGSYLRLPPISGNDLPGVIGLAAAERYGMAGSLQPGAKVAAWLPSTAMGRLNDLVAHYRLSLVWCSEMAPVRISGRRRVIGVEVPERIACDLVLVGVGQPAIELAAQAGVTIHLTTGELPVLVVDRPPPWLEIVGEAAATSSQVPDVEAHDEAFACLCEDVRVKDLRACVKDGFEDPELVKRRTGAMTGPCQGKTCASIVLAVLRSMGMDPQLTTPRPLLHPVALNELAADA